MNETKFIHDVEETMKFLIHSDISIFEINEKKLF